MGDALKVVVARLAAWAQRNPQTTTLRSPTGACAAVLVPLFQGRDGEVRVLLTKRSAALSSHAGEAAFPGGRMDATDADETAAALREAHEEVGLKARDATVVALFPYAVGQKALPVRPVVATIPTDFTPNPSADEVEAVFTQPLERFLSTEGHSSREIHFTRPAVGLGPGSVRMHSFQCGEHVVFGLTAHFCIQVAKVAFSKEPDFEEQSPNTALRLGTVLLPRPGGTAALDAAAPNARGGDADGASGPAACSGGDDVGAPPGGGGGLTRVAAAGQQHCGPPAAASQVGGDMRRGRDAAATATGGGRAAHCWGCDAGTTAGGGGQPPSQQQQQQLRAGDGCGGGGARQPLALAAVAARL